MYINLFYTHNVTKENPTTSYNPQTYDCSSSEFSESDSDCGQDQNDPKLSKKKIARLNNDLLKFIVKTSQPLSIVDDENFKETMCNNLNKKYKVPCSKTLSTEMYHNAVI